MVSRRRSFRESASRSTRHTRLSASSGTCGSTAWGSRSNPNCTRHSRCCRRAASSSWYAARVMSPRWQERSGTRVGAGRSGSADLGVRAARQTRRGVGRATALLHHSARRVCRLGAVAGRRGPLRRAQLLRPAALAGDRSAPGAGRARLAGDRDGRGLGASTRRAWPDDGRDWRAGGRAGAPQSAVRRDADRPAHARVRDRGAPRHGASGKLPSRAAGIVARPGYACYAKGDGSTHDEALFVQQGSVLRPEFDPSSLPSPDCSRSCG